MNKIAELELKLQKRDKALERICDELNDAAAFGRSPEEHAILAAVRDAYESEDEA